MTQPAHTGIARNYATTHENRIHDDDVAAKFGFKGGLVPGVTVFGLTSIPVTQAQGASCLTGHTLHTRFLKPAYHNETLQVFTATEKNVTDAKCFNADNQLLCTLQVVPGVAPSQLNDFGFDLNSQAIASSRENRPEISSSSIHVNEPFPVRPWRPTLEDNAQFAAEVDDANPLFSATAANANQPLVHPHLFLSQANMVLMDEFEMPAWMHVGSEVRLHAPLVVNREYRVFAQPIKQWERKGHEFITVYMAFEHEGAAVTEILHTAIYRIAGL